MLRRTLLILPFCGIMYASTSEASTEVEDSLIVAQADFNSPADSSFIVGEVIVVGNEKTQDHVLLREMTLRPGDYITRAAIEGDKKRIYNLGLFTRVEIGYRPVLFADPAASSPEIGEGIPEASLVIVVSERWYIYPFPLVGIKDRDWKKFYFGGGVTHQNFRGRNEKLYAALTLGYDPTVIFSYRNPLIDAENNYFLNTSLGWRVVRNRSRLAIGQGTNFDERHFTINLDFGKRFGLPHTAWASAAYEVVRVSEYVPGRTLSSDGTDAFPLFSIGYVYDTRDLQEYAMHGAFARATMTKYGVPGGTVNFVRYAFDYRRFMPITGRLSLAGRLFTDLSAGGEVPPYNRRYLGYSERVRGHFSHVVEGEQQLGTSWEMRFTLLEPRYITVRFIPIPEFAVWRFGVAAAVFGDAGVVWFRHEPLSLNRSIRGYGVGLHFIFPYGFVLRTEYALNEIRNGEFILDFSAAF